MKPRLAIAYRRNYQIHIHCDRVSVELWVPCAMYANDEAAYEQM